MGVKGISWLLVVAAAVGAGAALLESRTPSEVASAARSPAPRTIGGWPPGVVIAVPGDASAASGGPTEARVASGDRPAETPRGARIDDELRWTEQALASQRVAEPADTDFGPPDASPAGSPRLSGAIGALCKGAGFACGSSAECCPGLACDGGVAGYGTAGRCEGAAAR